MRIIIALVLGVLMVSCSSSALGPTTTPLNPTAPVLVPTTTSIPPTTAAPTPTYTAAPTLAPSPTSIPDLRWYWAIQNNEILAFNAAGKVNSVLDLSSVQQEGNDMAPVRLGEDRAFMFFGNQASPKAFLLTSDSATQIQLPSIQVPSPGNPWIIHIDHYPYIVIEASYGATVPAILINGETGQASLIANNVFVGYSYSEYFVRFSADGRWMRYAAGQEQVGIHNRDLQSGKDTLILQSSGYISTDAFGDVWYDSRLGVLQMADGQGGTLVTSDDNTRHLVLGNSWMLDSQYSCTQPCSLHVYPIVGNAQALDYSLPVNFSSPLVGDATQVSVNYGKILAGNRLLVGIYDQSNNDDQRNFWLLTPDGMSTLIGKGSAFSGNRLAGSSPGDPYILIYPTDASPEFRVFDPTTGKVLFSETTGITDVFIDMLFFPEGIIVQEQDTTEHDWVYNFATGVAVPFQLLDDYRYCAALTPDGRPICMNDSGVGVYDPVSGNNTELIQEPVTSLSN